MTRFLLVDDNAAALELMAYLLEAAGHPTVLAKNGAEACELARAEHPDVVVMDVRMPVMDGLEAAAELRSAHETSDVVLVAVTANATCGERERVFAAGFNGYMTKPIDPYTFVDSLMGFAGAA